MGQRGGPNIPLDNINSYSDSLNTRSYAGTGNTISCLFSKFNYSFLNSPTVSTILKNIVLTLNGSTQYATSDGTTSNLSGSSSKSLVCWVYLNSTANQSIVSFGNNSSGNTGFELAVSGGNFIFRTGPGYSYTLQSAAINTWYHFAITYVTTLVIVGNYVFFVNGQQYSTGTAPVSSAAVTALSIGNPLDSANFGRLNGTVNQAMTYSTNLTAAQVSQIYNSSKSRYGL